MNLINELASVGLTLLFVVLGLIILLYCDDKLGDK